MNRTELRRLNFHIKRLDKSLVALPNGNHVAIYENRNGAMHLVFALTHNWQVTGYPVPWGIEVIQARIRAIDVWNNDDSFNKMLVHNERIDQSNEKDNLNNIESFLYDFRRQFAKATNDINTGTLEKKDRRNQNGNRQSRFRF